jgi:hypothetical protein
LEDVQLFLESGGCAQEAMHVGALTARLHQSFSLSPMITADHQPPKACPNVVTIQSIPVFGGRNGTLL